MAKTANRAATAAHTTAAAKAIAKAAARTAAAQAAAATAPVLPIAAATGATATATPLANGLTAIAVPYTGPARKYGANAGAIAGAATQYTLHASVQHYTAATARTVMHAVVMAAIAAGATATAPVSKAAIVQQMLTNAAVLAVLAKCKAVQYVARGVPCPAWAGGYVAGAGRTAYLAKQ